MRIAITGGTGFLGRHVASALAHEGHEIVLLARGNDQTDRSVLELPRTHFCAVGLDSVEALRQALAGCDAVAHCAGINREMGLQTYRRVHIEGTRNVVEAARLEGVRKVVLISFLRARPDCGSCYHESKWAAEEIVRGSGLDYTVLKCGVIYGRGDHLLDHLSHALHTFPMFALVGFREQPIRPTAVEDVARIVKAALVNGALSRQTVAVFGPEELPLRTLVRRIADVTAKRPVLFPLPVGFHYVLGWLMERVMTVPLISVAQVRILSESLAEPQPPCAGPPADLVPATRFSHGQIRKGLPPAGRFGPHHLRCCRRRKPAVRRHRHAAFFELA